MNDNQTGFPDFIAPLGLTPLAAEPDVRPVGTVPFDTAPAVPTPDVPAPVSTSDPSTTPGRPSWRTIVTIGLVVVALIAVGLATWLGGWQILNPAPSCKPIDSTKYTVDDGEFPSQQVALLDGQTIPARVEVVGVWCDVAFIDLEYQKTENLNGDHSYTYFNTDVLRAVDVSAGRFYGR